MRRHRPRNPVLLWATRSIVFRNHAPRTAEAGGIERPRFTARAVDWVSWLAEVPVGDGEPALAGDPGREAEAAPSRAIAAARGGSLRVSLKIRHTI